MDLLETMTRPWRARQTRVDIPSRTTNSDLRYGLAFVPSSSGLSPGTACLRASWSTDGLDVGNGGFLGQPRRAGHRRFSGFGQREMDALHREGMTT